MYTWRPYRTGIRVQLDGEQDVFRFSVSFFCFVSVSFFFVPCSVARDFTCKPRDFREAMLLEARYHKGFVTINLVQGKGARRFFLAQDFMNEQHQSQPGESSPPAPQRKQYRGFSNR